ncbi:thioredoxin family protein [Methyloradius palustris]|uniref:Thiol reductase thioredoxin n=1 Tax=Methyloradius palustris TaxID=2778876 RepID=A0A8D5JZP8_9PROT|nr:thioredoxin family protein [Methyloradius palustris]BCM23923.1 thiol reductase thioredoxin [Methyloradius palustris]
MNELTIVEIEALDGATILEFGTDWCGYCKAAQPLIASALAERQDVRHIKIEDGKGRRLGRLFKVKLWPTLVFLKNGQEVGRLIRPDSAVLISEALDKI